MYQYNIYSLKDIIYYIIPINDLMRQLRNCCLIFITMTNFYPYISQAYIWAVFTTASSSQ